MKRIFIILLCLVPILYMGCSGEEHEQVKKSAPEESEYPMFDDDDEANKPLDNRLFYFVDGEGNEIATNTLHCPYTQDESEYLTYAGTADAVTLNGTMPVWGKAELDQANKRLIATALEENPEGSASSIVEITLTASKGTGDDQKSVDVKIYLARRPGPESPATLSFSTTSASLAYRANSTADVTLTSNKNVFEVSIPAADKSWLTYSITGNVLTFKAISKNPSTENSRSSTVTVTAGVNLTTSEDIVVTQAPAEPPKIEVNELYYENDVAVGMIWKVVAPNFYLVSLKNTKLIWASSESDATGMNIATNDGMTNTAAIMLLHGTPNAAGTGTNNYPAAAYCADMGTGWFLPSTGELTDLRSALAGKSPYTNPPYPFFVDPGAVSDGIAELIEGALHWSSREHATTLTQAQAVNLSIDSSASGPYGKSGTNRPVRCMRIMPLPTP